MLPFDENQKVKERRRSAASSRSGSGSNNASGRTANNSGEESSLLTENSSVTYVPEEKESTHISDTEHPVFDEEPPFLGEFTQENHVSEVFILQSQNFILTYSLDQHQLSMIVSVL